MNTWYYAFFIGLAGSWHCAIMCGPIVQQMHIKGNTRLRGILYPLGRLSMYALLGAMVAGVGSIWIFPMWWHIYYVVAGIVLLGIMSKHIGDHWFTYMHQTFGKYLQNIGKRLGAMGYFFLGLSHGLLPCGLVIGGLSIALIQPNPWLGALSMVAFGLSTIPAIQISVWGFSYFKNKGSSFARVIQGIAWFIALILIFRGAWGIGMTQSTYLRHADISTVICHPFGN